MKNIYDGIVRLDENGAAEVNLPEWFEALNSDFRYLLTPIGAPAPGLYFATGSTRIASRSRGAHPEAGTHHHHRAPVQILGNDG
jgi:hypothetical protein